MILTDYPMKCCGMVEASVIRVQTWDNTGRDCSAQEKEVKWDTLFQLVEEHQRKHRRNCGLITLSEEQVTAKIEAEKRGWKAVFEFYNPNSKNQVWLYTKVLWASEEEYDKAVFSGEYITPKRPSWIYPQPEVEHAL